MPRKLIIDADPGIGDALAIAVAALDPNIDLIGVTAVPGCVAGMVATQNILSVIESVDPDKHPRLGASTAPRPVFSQAGVHPPGFLDPLRLNGNYGLGTAEIPMAQLHNQRESAKLLIDLVKNNPYPSEAEIRSGLEGNLCRCTGYHNIVKSVLAAASAGA